MIPNTIEYPLSKVSELEELRVEIIKALNYVGVSCPSNTSFHDLPDYVMMIGGTDTSRWPIDLSAIGYDAEDCRRASYRYLERRIREDSGNNSNSYLNLSNIIDDALYKEIPKSILKANEWNNLSAQAKGERNGFFNTWDGAFCPYIDTTDARNMDGWFDNAHGLVHVPLLNTINAVSIQGLFAHDTQYLMEYPEFDCRNVVNVESIRYDSFTPTYIFGLKNIGYDPSTNTYHSLESCYCMLMFAGWSTGGWWCPTRGMIVVHPIWLYNIQKGNQYGNIDGGWGINVNSIDALYHYDHDFYLSSDNISYNSLVNLATTVRDVSNDTDREWTPTISIHTDLYNNPDKWTPAIESTFRTKGWAINVRN
jgi:hypothetical protein